MGFGPFELLTHGLLQKGRDHLDTWTLQWCIASSLPQPLHEATMTICGSLIYMLGGFDESDKQSKSVFACRSCQQQSLKERLKTSLTRRPKVWHPLADTPCSYLIHMYLIEWTTAGSGWTGFTAVHMYNTITNSWEVISHMVTPRFRSLVAVLPHNKLMVVGGQTPGSVSNSIEIATIVWQCMLSVETTVHILSINLLPGCCM